MNIYYYYYYYYYYYCLFSSRVHPRNMLTSFVGLFAIDVIKLTLLKCSSIYHIAAFPKLFSSGDHFY
jgi:hypothetical protein